MNINAVHRTMTALPLIAMLALAAVGVVEAPAWG